MWGPSNISKICFRETQEFPRFLSPPIAGSSSAFLESEHLYSFYSWFPPLQLSPYLTPATTVKACLPLPRLSPHPPSPQLHARDLSHRGILLFPIYISYFFLLRISLQSLGETEYWQESSLFSTVCHWLFLTEKEKGEPDTFLQEPGSALVTWTNTSTGWLFDHFLFIRTHPFLRLQALSFPYFPGSCGELTGMLSEIRSNRQCRCSVAKSCPALCDPMDCRTPDVPVPHCHLEFAQ